jgi:hypothetical protein
VIYAPSLRSREGDGGEFMKFYGGKEVLFKVPFHPVEKTFIVFVRIWCERVRVFKLLKDL